MKINKLLLIAAALVLSFAVLTACGGETTTDAIPTPEATPNSLASMDEVNRAFLLYERWCNAEIISCEKNGSVNLELLTPSDKFYEETYFNIISININQENFVEYMRITELSGCIIESENELGFSNGYKFRKASGILGETDPVKIAISVEQYIQETQFPRMYEVLKPIKGECNEIQTSQDEDELWNVKFFWSGTENIKTVLKELVGEDFSYDEIATDSLEMVYFIRLTEQGYPAFEGITVCTNPDSNSEAKVNVTVSVHYDMVNNVKSVPEIDLSQYEDITPPDQYEALLEGYETATVHNVKFLSRRDNAWFNENMIMVTSSQDLIQLLGDKVSEDKIATYNDEYFNDKVVLLVQFMHFSGSDQIHKFVGVIVNNNKMYPVVVNGFRGLGTADIKHTIILVELDKECVEMELGRILEIDRYSDEPFNPNFGER